MPKRDGLSRLALIIYAALLISPLVIIAFRFEDRLHINVEKPTSFTEWALVVITAVYAAVSTLQWWKMRQSLDETRRANNLTLRAWVMARRVELVELTAEEGKTAARLVLKNYGKSPAIRWSYMHEFVVTRPGESVFLGPAPRHFEPERGSSLAPGATMRLPMTLWPLSPEDVEAVREGEAFLWLVIRYSYTDMTGSTGTSVYAWVFFRETPTRRARFARWWIPETGDW